MFKNLDKTDKRIIATGIWTTVILTATVLINTPAIDSYLADSSAPSSTTYTEVTETETPEVNTAATQESLASVSVADNTDGSADIFIDLPEPSQVTGAELYFSVDGEVLGASIDCADVFDCVGSEINDNSIAIYAFRLPTEVQTELSGKIKVATVSFDPLSSATLTTNDTRVGQLLITALGTGENIADPTVRSYTIGQ